MFAFLFPVMGLLALMMATVLPLRSPVPVRVRATAPRRVRNHSS